MPSDNLKQTHQCKATAHAAKYDTIKAEKFVRAVPRILKETLTSRFPDQQEEGNDPLYPRLLELYES